MPRRLAVALALVATACSGDDGGTGDRGDDEPADRAAGGDVTTTVAPDPAGALPGAHDCVPPDGGGARIAWDELRNPIFETDAMAKDQSVRFVDGAWHLFFSSRSTDPRLAGLGHATSDDWTAWEPVTSFADPGGSPGGSPDITRAADGRYVVAHQVARPENPSSRHLVYRATEDLSALAATEAQPLFPEIYPTERLIDVAFAHTEWGLFAMFKRGARDTIDQTPTLVHSPSGSLDGPWTLVGDPEVGLFENFQFVPIDGRWHLLGTRIPLHWPELYRLDGDPSDRQQWLQWTPLGELVVPEEDWNTGELGPGVDYERANSAFLCDARAVDGHFYLFYAGSTELTTNEGRGHAKIGVARSTDLRQWRVPPN